MSSDTPNRDALRIDLSGDWLLASADNSHALTIALPGDVHSALQRAGIIADPYHGRNEAEIQWVARKEWVLERTVVIGADDLNGGWYLDFESIDTVASVFVNEQLVLTAENCFRRYRPDVSDAIVAGENRIRIILHSAIAEGERRQAAQPFYVPYHDGNSPIANGNMLRKPQCHFGWDWNIAIAPLGVYGSLALCRLETARIEHLTTRQLWLEDGSVDLQVTVQLFARDPGIVPVYFTLDGVRERLDCAVGPGETRVTHVFTIEEPRRWWPAGSGDQAFSTLKVEVPGETVTRQIGFRTIKLVTDSDEAGSRFAFRVNGREVFCRGANWIPADALRSRVTPEAVEDLLRSAVDANMNMIRVWGGGFYEPDWFYDLCDRLGLLVWQDFMFACNLYPSTPGFLENVADEVDYQVRRLSTHPSIALWCGDNELVGALTWFEESRKDRDRYLVSYDRLNRTVETAMRRACPEAIWWPSSPSAGYLDFGDAWHADGAGDMHYWSVWHENKSFDNYRTVRPRFCSEFGFQSYTSMPVIRQFAGERDLNIASPVMEAHQKNAGGNERIAGTMFRYFRFPKDFPSFVYLSQIQQGLAIRTAVDYWRSLKPHCMGTLYWQLNDTWPVTSWSSLDFGGQWKAMHYMARRFFQPVAVAAIPSAEGSEVAISMVNDTAEPVTVELQAFLVSLDGERQPLLAVAGTCSPDRAATLVAIAAKDIPSDMLLFWSFEASNGSTGEGHYVNGTYKALDLAPSGLTVEAVPRPDGSFDVSVKAAGLALHVMIEADIEGRYSDNAFDLTAGETKSIRFRPRVPVDAGASPRFSAYDLETCQGKG
ncbi:glycoside hydrolase family 2 protein [Sinorhizobium medicae]|uniref:beta-mannosidase n=1 Tax=Sinorhizobium medicae TaxID=110321 RepID=UPI000FE03D9D|nr:glycoside hydrolase family 2 protein [Sinorhizobium medicae]MDX0702273.1 glycoside hydrolase family 2 protein [Sinorhizobium medicae]RVJ13391.1 glycoside hydrolase family 2 protein [Sinorhizobium medicae]